MHPHSFPKTMDLWRAGWENLRSKWLRLLGLIAIGIGAGLTLALLSWVVGAIIGRHDVILNIWTAILVALKVFVNVFFTVAFYHLMLTNENIDSILAKSWKQLLRAVGTSIVTSLIVIAGFVLFVFPGVVLSILLAFPIAVLVVENETVLGSIKKSFHITKNFFWTIFARHLVFCLTGLVVLAVLGGICFISVSGLMRNYSHFNILTLLQLIIAVVSFVAAALWALLFGFSGPFFRMEIFKNLMEAHRHNQKENMHLWKKVLLALLIVVSVLLFVGGFILGLVGAAQDGFLGQKFQGNAPLYFDNSYRFGNNPGMMGGEMMPNYWQTPGGKLNIQGRTGTR